MLLLSILVCTFLIIIILILKGIEQNNITNEIKKNHVNQSEIINYSNYYEKKEYIFTRTELQFYYQLKTQLEDTNLSIFAKTRLVDLFTIKENKNKLGYFNKIKAKHIDFIICKNNGKILACIELDDKSHETQKRIKRDILVDKLFNDLKLPLYRFKVTYQYDFTILKKQLMQPLQNNIEEQKELIKS